MPQRHWHERLPAASGSGARTGPGARFRLSESDWQSKPVARIEPGAAGPPGVRCAAGYVFDLQSCPLIQQCGYGSPQQLCSFYPLAMFSDFK
jgi:hypothetical protein